MNPTDNQSLNDFAVIEGSADSDPTTNLIEDDIQCGLIFFSETTRVLKFFCTYCEKVSENINYFCQHLSEHINDDDKERLHGEFTAADTHEDSLDGDATATTTTTTTAREEVTYEASPNQSLLPCDLAGFDESKMVVEELDEAEEIAAEVEAEMRQELEGEQMYANDENSCPEDIFNYVQPGDCMSENHLKTENQKREHASADDFKKTSERHVKTMQFKNSNKKKKRVTTVKVIALKNRVAELYERIKLEEERRSRIYATNPDSCDGNDLPVDEQNDTPVDGSIEPMRQIIGETVITLLPQNHETKVELAKFSGNITPMINPINRQDSADDKTTCPACGRKFRSAFSLTIHKRTHYLESDSNVKLAHKCSDCDQLFNKIPDLKDHIQQVHYPDGFICKICNKKLTSLTLLETHMRKVHLSRPFNCEICRKNFDTRDRFEEHVKAHVSGQPYRCHICGRKYSTECILKQHLRRHKEQIPQCCVVCGKMTLRITQHMKIHAPRPKRILSCKACGKVFNFSSGLSHHYKVMHKLQKSPSKPKQENAAEMPTDQGFKTELVEFKEEAAGTESTEEIIQKEEEAKRVIVELIQNATYTSFFPENFNSSMDSGPPIAREETISAVNSIVNEENS